MKASTAFNTEHVIPAAFGRFENGLTLGRPRERRVCTECNQRLGDELDIGFARNSWEGLLRITRHAALGNPRQAKYDRVEFWLPPTHPMAPMQLCLTRHPQWDGAFCTAVAQLRLTFGALDKRCIPEGRIATDVPSMIQAKGQPTTVEMFCSSEDPAAFERMTVAGREAGITVVKWISMGDTAQQGIENIEAYVSLVIDGLVARAVAKIALEYFVWNLAETMPGLVRDDLLAPIRTLVLDGVRDWRPFVVPTNAPMLADETTTVRHADCHLVSMMWGVNGVVVRVALFNDIVYRVHVCDPPSPIYHPIDVGHHFDLRTGRVSTLVTSRTLHPPPRRSHIVRLPR